MSDVSWTPLLCFVTSCCVFIYLFNRAFLAIKDGLFKPIVTSLGLLAVVAVPPALAPTFEPRLVTCACLFLMGAFLIGEGRRHVLRHRYRGAEPIEKTGSNISLVTPVTTTRLSLPRYEVCSSSWSLPRLRVVHLSDLHLRGGFIMRFFKETMEKVNALEPDLIFLTGDFVSSAKFIPLLPDLLARLTASRGVFAVLGNHDYWIHPQEIKAALKAAGINWLGNGQVRILFNEGCGLTIRGHEKPWGDGEASVGSFHPEEPTLVLTHTPDVIYDLVGQGNKRQNQQKRVVSKNHQARQGMSDESAPPLAVFAGHTHAGQIRFPGWGSLVVPSRFGRRFDRGHFVVDETHLFVTSGLGVVGLPLRIYCQPEIVLVDFFNH